MAAPDLIIGSTTITFPHHWTRPNPQAATRRGIANIAISGNQETVNIRRDQIVRLIWDGSLTLADTDLRRQLENFIELATIGTTFAFKGDSAEAAQSTLNGAVTAGDPSIDVIDATGGTGFVEENEYVIVSQTRSETVKIASGGISGNTLTLEENIQSNHADGVLVRSREFWPQAKLMPPYDAGVLFPPVNDVSPLRWSFDITFREVL